MTVYLVGAGPGDPRLITVRGRELLERADVVIYDRLAAPELVALAPASALRIDAGKRPDHHVLRQEATNELLVEHGRTGATVVRLKGGDPFVFGRGSEEAQALREAGVAYEVVPGITSAIAVPAYAGIPVTHRGLATHFTVVTGHEDPEKGTRDVDWAALAAAGGTLVLLMGVRGLPAISRALVAGGRAADTPAAVIASGTTARQHVVSGTLGTIAALAADVANPAITVVGEVAALRDAIAWAETRPLHGVTVAVTRARPQASKLSAHLRDLGATVLETSAIRIETIADVKIDPTSYELICVSSPNTPRLLVDAIGGDVRQLDRHVTVAAIGPGTARALREVGIVADVVAETAVAEGLLRSLRELRATRATGWRTALVVGAEESRETLAAGLAAVGVDTVERLAVYRTLVEPASAVELAAADLVTFSSASTVRSVVETLGDMATTLRGVSIGPITSAEAAARGVTIVREADTHDLAGLADAVVAAARELRGNR